MPSLVTLLFYGAIFVAAASAIGGFIWHERDLGYKKAEAVYKPQVEEAKAANEALGRDVEKLRGFVKESKESLDKLKLESDAKQKEAKSSLDAARKRLASIPGFESEIESLRNIAQNPVITERDCEDAADIIDGVLRKRLQLDGIAIPGAVNKGGSGDNNAMRGKGGPSEAASSDPRRSGKGIEEAKGSGGGRR